MILLDTAGPDLALETEHRRQRLASQVQQLLSENLVRFR
jgi:hypothetical protein